MNSRQKLERRKEKGEGHKTSVRTPGCGSVYVSVSLNFLVAWEKMVPEWVG